MAVPGKQNKARSPCKRVTSPTALKTEGQKKVSEIDPSPAQATAPKWSEQQLAQWFKNREANLETLHLRAKHTGNPLYVWEAIASCGVADFPRHPLPEWCLVYLTTVATMLVTTGKLQHAGPRDGESAEQYSERLRNWTAGADISADEATCALPRILGLRTGHGNNDFRQYRSNQLLMGEAIVSQDPGIRAAIAVGDQVRVRGKLMEKHTFEARVRKGRKLLKP